MSNKDNTILIDGVMFVEKSFHLSEYESAMEYGFEQGKAKGYARGYNKGFEDGGVVKERNLKEETINLEQAYEEGYDQAIDDLIEAGVIGEEEYSDEDCSEEYYSEYEFGDVEDNEEEYYFYKELDRILKSSQEQYEADPSVPSMGNRYDENGKVCGFFINTGNEKIGGIEGSERKHSHYFKDVRHLDYLDVYQVCKLFPVEDDSGAITHARKKLLVAGGRGAGKDMIKDITEARDTLNRYLQIEGIE